MGELINQINYKMKFAIAALVSAISALDFIGCEGADWGDMPAMKEEAHCIFHKAAHGHKEMNAAEGTAALDKWCHWKYPTASAAKCKGGAIKGDELLNSHFGHNNEIDEKEFYQAYLYVKGHEEKRSRNMVMSLTQFTKDIASNGRENSFQPKHSTKLLIHRLKNLGLQSKTDLAMVPATTM